jgi:hypothetical protein
VRTSCNAAAKPELGSCTITVPMKPSSLSNAGASIGRKKPTKISSQRKDKQQYSEEYAAAREAARLLTKYNTAISRTRKDPNTGRPTSAFLRLAVALYGYPDANLAWAARTGKKRRGSAE